MVAGYTLFSQADETQAPQRGLVERMKQEFELKLVLINQN